MPLLGRWTFSGLGGPWDETENWQSVEFFGAAGLTHRGLELKQGGWARVRMAPGSRVKITQKTLIAWIVLDDLANKRPAGSAMTLDSLTIDRFDGIVLGERSDATWAAGSSNLLRTPPDSAENPKETRTGQLVKLAVTYSDCGGGAAEVRLYRNDVLCRTYRQGNLAEWAGGDAEVVFGARHTLKDETRGWLAATLVAAELWDECLTLEALQRRVPTDPSSFIRPAISLQSLNYPDRLLVADLDGNAVQLVQVAAVADDATACRASFTVLPGLADARQVSLQVHAPAGAYVVATDTGVAVRRDEGTDAFRRAATFEQLPGLAGAGFSYKSLAQPGKLLRHASFRLRLDADDGSDLCRKDMSFTRVDGRAPGSNTELPLGEQAWYTISNHWGHPEQVLGLTATGAIELMPVPTSGPIDHLMWRVAREPGSAGQHRWLLINKKAGDGKQLDSGKDTVSLEPASNASGQRWLIRPIPWMGSDYFAMTNEFVESDGKTLDYVTVVDHGSSRSRPGHRPINLDYVGQRWRFSLVALRDGVQRPSLPPRIAGLECGPGSVSGPRTPPSSAADYARVYPRYLGGLGIDFIATAGVSDWALSQARTVLCNLLLTLRDRGKIASFDRYRIIVVGDNDVNIADYPDFGWREANEWRGGTDNLIARVTEEMMCRTGVTNRPADRDARKYDQLVHEFGHTIDIKLGLRMDQNPLTSGSAEQFPWWCQAWFDCAAVWGSSGTRAGFVTASPEPAKFMRTLFLTNREWRPYAWPRRGGA